MTPNYQYAPGADYAMDCALLCSSWASAYGPPSNFRIAIGNNCVEQNTRHGIILHVANSLPPIEYVTCDANEAVASVAYRLNELVAIFPITPSSPMAEFCDEWAAAGRPNLWGQVPRIVEMQSEGGVAGAVHGGLLGGALTTTFTASQGLLLMIPNLYKIAGELLPLHGARERRGRLPPRACRSSATTRTSWPAGPPAARSSAATPARRPTTSPWSRMPRAYRSRVPFIHFFDGFRTSHEVSKLALLPDEVLRSVMDEEDIAEFRVPRHDARPPDPAGHRPEPRRLLPGPRGGEPVLRRPAGGRAGHRWTCWRPRPAAPTASSTTTATPRPSA